MNTFTEGLVREGGGGPVGYVPPNLTERLVEQEIALTKRLALVREALAAVREVPGLERAINLVSQVT